MFPLLALVSASAAQAAPSQMGVVELAVEIEKRAKTPAIVVSCGATNLNVEPTGEKVADFVDPSIKKGFLYSTSDMAMLREVTLPEAKWGVLKGLIDSPAPTKLEMEMIPESAIAEDTLKFTSTKGKSIDLKSIGNLKFSKQIVVSPYFMGDRKSAFVIGLSASNGVSGLEFSRALAKCLGGTFKITNKSWEVGFDAASWQQGFRRVFALAQKGAEAGRTPAAAAPEQPQFGQYYQRGGNGVDTRTIKAANVAAMRVLGELVGQMNPKLIAQTFEYASTSTRINLNSVPALRPALRNYFNTISPATTGTSGTAVTRRNGVNVPPNLLNRIDGNNPGSITIETNFQVSVDLNLVPATTQNNNRTPQQTAPAVEVETIKIQML